MRIGNLTIGGKVLLAPMAGITDLPFRRLCRRFGAAVVYSEFLSSDGLILNTMNQSHKLALAADEHPVAYQLFGARTELFVQAAKGLSVYGPDLIDLNFGCPVKKVVKGKAGAAILRDLGLMRDIVAGVAEAVPIPVTVKMRAGWDANTLVHIEAAQRAIEAGAQAVTLHARTRADGNWGMEYGRGARWEWIAELKSSITDIPVIGNGDVVCPQTAKRMLEETACDAIMIARAAIGRPWIFAEINHYLETVRGGSPWGRVVESVPEDGNHAKRAHYDHTDATANGGLYQGTPRRRRVAPTADDIGVLRRCSGFVFALLAKPTGSTAMRWR